MVRTFNYLSLATQKPARSNEVRFVVTFLNTTEEINIGNVKNMKYNLKFLQRQMTDCTDSSVRLFMFS